MVQWTQRIAVLVIFLLCSASLIQAEEGGQFTKLDEKGQELSMDAGQWSMIRDNTTGLIWEVKTMDGSVHDMENTYDWNSAHEAFIAELNRMKFGGFEDWRLPTTEELRTIRVKGSEPLINLELFPNTAPTGYLSWRKCGSGEIFDERVKFGKIRNTKKDRRVRAVRGGVTKSE